MPIGPPVLQYRFLLLSCFRKPRAISSGEQEGSYEGNALSAVLFLTTLPSGEAVSQTEGTGSVILKYDIYSDFLKQTFGESKKYSI
jgi:hypothetical protein